MTIARHSHALAAALLAAAGLAFGPGGCASSESTANGESSQTGGTPSTPGPRQHRDGMAALRALADQQRTTPDPFAGSIPELPGVPTGEQASLPTEEPGRTAATEPLDAALARFPAEPVTTAPNAERPDPDQQLQSIKLYASAREHLAAGRQTQAVSDLERASRIDPTSPAIQRALGDAYAAAGRRSAAIAAYRKAVQAGLRDPALLGVLGREALRARRFDDAVPPLRSALAEAQASGESQIMAPLNIDLAEALLGAGHVRAARDLLTDTLASLPAEPPEGVTAASAAEVYRRRAELWQRIGDLSLRLDDAPAAEAAYARAAAFPTVDPVSLIPRRINALVRSGRTAEAALLLLAEIDRVEGRIEDRHLSTLAALSRSPTIGAPLADAIAQTLRAPGTSVTPSTAARLARAAAACVPPEGARRVLLARLEAFPTDTQCLPPLLAAYGDDAVGRARTIVGLITLAPDQCDEYAEIFLRRGSGVAKALAWLGDRRGDPGASLFRAALLRRLHRYDEALAALDSAKPPPAFRSAFEAMRAQCAASGGRWDTALAARDAAVSLAEAPPARHTAAAVAAVQDSSGAYEALRVSPAAPPADWRGVPDFLLAADYAMRAGKPTDAETLLIAAKALDKYDERPYDALIDLYQPRGPLADDTRLTSLARELRDNIPSSKVARGIAARELLSRGLWDQAVEQLTAMLDADSETLGTLSLLTAAWESQVKADPGAGQAAEDWVRARLNGREESPTLVIVLARVMAARGDAADAVALLQERHAALPNPDLLRMQEVIIRTNLDDKPRAAALAMERLEPSPRGIAETIELAELLLVDGRFDRAVGVLDEGLPARIRFTPEQTARILALLGVFKPEQVAEGDAAQGEAALRLFDLVEARGIDLPPQSYLVRVLLLCASHPDDTERLLAAARDAAAKTQQTEPQMYFRVSQVLLAAKNPSPGLRFLGAAVNSIEPFGEPLAFHWFQMVYSRGEGDDIRHLVTTIRYPRDMLGTIVAQFSGDEVPIETDTDARAEIAYWLGNGASTMNRDQAAEQGYREALALKPGHAWTLNNLGYLLLERGDAFAEAGRMIEAAYRTLSEDASVIDSLGWLRYKQGVFADGVDAEGKPVTGAVTLLRRAVDSGVKETNAEQTDHLADALWRTGQKDEARRRWAQAQNLLQVNIAMLNTRNAEQSPAADRLKQHLASVQAKVRALDEGREPPVAPTQAEFEAARGRTK